MVNRNPNPERAPTQENQPWASFDVNSSFIQLETALSTNNLATEVIQKKKALFLEWLSSNIFAGGSFSDFQTEQTAAGIDNLERSDYHARLATKDAKFKRIYDDVQSISSAWLWLSDVNNVGLWSWADSPSPEVTSHQAKLVSLKKNLVTWSYESTVWGYVQTMKQEIWSDVMWAWEYAKMQQFISKFLDPSTGTVTLPWDRKIVFKQKDLSFQSVNGSVISNLDQHSLSGDTGFGSNLFVPHYVIDATQTDPEIARLLMSWWSSVSRTGDTVNFTDKHLKYLPYVFMAATLWDSALATKKIKESLWLPISPEETSEEYVNRASEWLDVVSNHEEFAKRFNSLSWDAGVTFLDGKLEPKNALIYFNDSGDWISDLPGGGNNRVKASITQEWSKIRIKMLDTTDFIIEWWSTEFEYPINGASMDFLINSRWWTNNIVKAQHSASLKNVTQWLWYLWWSWNLSGFDQETVQNAWSGGHVFEGNKTRSHEKSHRNIKDITYLGYPTGSNKYKFYEVSQGSDSVTVSYHGRSKTMDYTTFALFVLDKGLLPFSKPEYDNATKEIEEIEPGSVFNSGYRKWLSLGSAFALLKWIPDAMLAKFKKDEELRSAEAEVWLYDKLGFIPGVDKFDAQKKLDGLVQGEMEQRKNQLLGLDVEGSNSTSDKKLLWVNEVAKDFDSLSFGNKSHMRTLWWDFLYILELNEIYEWALSKYSSEHIWVKKLLWPEHYKVFRAKFHKEHDAIRNLPGGTSARRDALVKMELDYIAGVTKKDKQLQRIYGTKFYKTIEDYQEETLWKTASLVKESAKNWPFDQVYGAASAQLGKLSAPKFIGFLEVALSKVNTVEERNKVNMMILQYYSSWTNHKAIKLNADRLESMGRRYGNPLLKIANNVNAPRIVINLADAVWKKWDPLSKRLTYGWTKDKNGEYIEMHNYSLWWSEGTWSNKDRVKETAKRRSTNGNNFMDAIYFNNNNLFKEIWRLWKTNRSHAQERKYQDLDYFYTFAVLGNEWDALGDNDSAHQSSPLYSDSILNLTWWTFKSLMIDTYSNSNGRFKSTDTELLRNNLTDKIMAIDSQLSNAWPQEKEYLLHLVTKKYMDYFKWLMSWDRFSAFQRALVGGKWVIASNKVQDFATKKGFTENAVMEKAFWVFARFFRDHASKISTYNKKWVIMSSVFTDFDANSVPSSYAEAAKKRMKAESNIKTQANS